MQPCGYLLETRCIRGHSLFKIFNLEVLFVLRVCRIGHRLVEGIVYEDDSRICQAAEAAEEGF